MTPRVVAIVLLALLSGPAMAGANDTAASDRTDPLLSPPDALPELVAVPDLDLSGAEQRTRDAIREARQSVRDALADPATDPTDLAEAYGRLGGLYHVHRMPAGATAAYRNARTLDPEHFRWVYLDAWLAQGVGRLENALEAYGEAHRIDPDYPPLNLRKGEVLAELNEPEQAGERLRVAVEEPGLEAAAAFRLGQIALQRRDFAAAEKWLRRALRSDPDADRVHGPLAQALRGQGDMAAAREALERHGNRAPVADDRLVRELEALDTGARRHFQQGLVAVRDNRFQAGAEAFERGVAEDPDNLDARISLARAQYLAGNREAAREQLDTVLAREPHRPLALFLLALLHEVDGDTEQARAGYETVLELRPTHAGAAHHLGMLAFRQQEWADAARLLTLAGEETPDNVLARVLAIVAEARERGESPELASRLGALVESRPQHPLPRYALSRLHSASTDPEIRDAGRGMEMAEDLLSQSPIPPAYEALALARAAVNDIDGADAALQEAAIGYRHSGAMSLLPRIEEQRDRVRDGRLPAAAWPVDDPVLRPPPIDPRGVFQEYPTPRPF